MIKLTTKNQRYTWFFLNFYLNTYILINKFNKTALNKHKRKIKLIYFIPQNKNKIKLNFKMLINLKNSINKNHSRHLKKKEVRKSFSWFKIVKLLQD